MEEGMTKEQPAIYVGIDFSKGKLAVAIADGGVRDEVVSLGTFENAPASVSRVPVVSTIPAISMRASPAPNC